MIELLRRVAAPDPSRTSILTDDAAVSYGELLQRSEAVAGWLRAHSTSRLGVLGYDAADVVALLAGSSIVGAEVCQYAPTDVAAEVVATAEQFDHDVIVIGTDLVLADVRAVPAGAVQAADPLDAADLPAARPLLVLTTGTTGVPRGVRHDWSRIIRGTTRIAPAPGQRWLLAYGLHQFAGLQILVHVLAAGATLVAPAPRRPREGLAAMRAHGVTHASATPTYWRFLLAELRSDGGPVPDLQQITLGGEAIPGPLLPELRATFPNARISQVYAASEFGSSGSMRDGRSGLSTEVLRRGEDADIAMKIVDGELWVRSRTGMLGYYGEPPIDPDAWRATGDLVEVVDDRIYFRGRSTEIINVGGVKVHPLPIEERIFAVAGVELARVYGRPNPMTGAIVAVDVVATPGAVTDDVEDAIRLACDDLPAAARPRRIKFVEAIELAGNKIVRR